MLSLKSSFKIFPLFVPLVLRQDFVWEFPIMRFCICVHNANVEDKHTTRFIEAEYSRISMEVRSKLSFLCVGIPPFFPSPSTSPSGGSYFSCFRNYMHLRFVGNLSWGVCCPAHICPLLFQDSLSPCLCVCVWNRDRKRERVSVCVYIWGLLYLSSFDTLMLFIAYLLIPLFRKTFHITYIIIRILQML